MQEVVKSSPAEGNLIYLDSVDQPGLITMISTIRSIWFSQSLIESIYLLSLIVKTENIV